MRDKFDYHRSFVVWISGVSTQAHQEALICNFVVRCRVNVMTMRMRRAEESARSEEQEILLMWTPSDDMDPFELAIIN